uniref:Kinesin light chain n=1 Tax=Glossina brevipalpis TaxID=37001 RepID=A0A1A9X4D2_9MUSC
MTTTTWRNIEMSPKQYFFQNATRYELFTGRQGKNMNSNEMKMIVRLSTSLEKLENENRELKGKNRALEEHNEWLKEELSKEQEKLQIMETKLAAMEEEMKYLDFKWSLKNVKNNSTFIKESPKVERKSPTSTPSKPKNPPSSNSPNGIIPINLDLLHNLAVQYTLEGNYEVAISLCDEALNGYRNTNNGNHNDVITLLNIMSVIYTKQGAYFEASSFLEKSLLIRAANGSSFDATALVTLGNLAKLYWKCQRYREAEGVKSKLVHIKQQLLQGNNLEVAEHLKDLNLQEQSNFEEEQIYYHRTLNIYESQLNANDTQVKRTKLNLANSLIKQGKLQEAALLWLPKSAMRPVGPDTSHTDCILVVGVSRPKLAVVFLTVMLISLFLTFHVLYDSAVYNIQAAQAVNNRHHHQNHLYHYQTLQQQQKQQPPTKVSSQQLKYNQQRTSLLSIGTGNNNNRGGADGSSASSTIYATGSLSNAGHVVGFMNSNSINRLSELYDKSADISSNQQISHPMVFPSNRVHFPKTSRRLPQVRQ